MHMCSFREVVGKKVMSAIKRNDDGISFSCVDFLCALMQPMHDNFDLRQEQLNKRSLLSSKGFLEKLLQPLKDHVVSSIRNKLSCMRMYSTINRKCALELTPPHTQKPCCGASLVY